MTFESSPLSASGAGWLAHSLGSPEAKDKTFWQWSAALVFRASRLQYESPEELACVGSLPNSMRYLFEARSADQ